MKTEHTFTDTTKAALYEALKELDEATRHASRMRRVSCGEKLDNAECREIDAYLSASAALAQARGELNAGCDRCGTNDREPSSKYCAECNAEKLSGADLAEEKGA